VTRKQNEYLLDTDIIEHHLIQKSDTQSYLEGLLLKGLCFSTVLNASELLHEAKSDLEVRIIIDVLSGIKILGLHSRYSLLVAKYSHLGLDMNRALFCVVADYNKLPIITLTKSHYVKSKLTIYHPEEVVRE
jgi:hypothetical protein